MDDIPAETLSWNVSGMDCASCASRIRGAVERLPGVRDVAVSVMSERLTLTVDAGSTAPASIERMVTELGYTVAREGAPASLQGPDVRQHGPDHAPGHADGAARDLPWFRTARGRLVVGTGALLAAAWLLHLLLPGAAAPWLFSAACLVGLVPIASRAFAAARRGMPFTIEMLMTISATGALVIGAAEEAAVVVFLFAVGELLEGVAAGRARASISALGALVPSSAVLVSPDGLRSVDAAALGIGDSVLVRPGDRVPADGEILEGVSGVDESPVTGESVPKAKGPGDPVFAGSINTEAALLVRVDRAAEDNTIARIIRLVEEAQEARAPTERFIDRFSRGYMPAIVGLAVLVAVLPPLLAGGAWETWIYRALALLLIGCPCALVISVPASIASSLSSGARRGLLMKGGTVIETAARTRVVVFDKTGTLTAGRPVVTDVIALAGDAAMVLATASGVEAGSSHPLAQAVRAEAEARGVTPEAMTASRVIPGHGVEATTAAGARAFVGASRALEGVPPGAAARIDLLEAEGKTVAAVVEAGNLIGLVALRDEPRPDAAEAVAALAALGVGSVMLTGDNARTAEAVAGALGLVARAELMPDDKVAALGELGAGLMMVGDGINDAPALAAADVGVAMGSGTDVALETADAALLRSRVSDVPALIRLARATMANIRQNIAVALGLKAVFLVTTVIGVTGLWIAIMADTGATVLVTLNALRLLGYDPTKAG